MSYFPDAYKVERSADAGTTWEICAYVPRADYTVATDSIAGSLSANTPFSCERNGQVEFDLDSLPNAGLYVLIAFRIQDASNYWRVVITSGGDLVLQGVKDGAQFYWSGAAGVLSGGERIKATFNKREIKLYYNTTLAHTNSKAVDFEYVAAGKVQQVDSGAAASDLETYPNQFFQWTDTGLQPGTSYTYRVSAIGSDGAYSLPSDTATQSTNGINPGKGTNRVRARVILQQEAFYPGYSNKGSEDVSNYVIRGVLTTNKHGHEAAQLTIDKSKDQSVRWFSQRKGKVTVVSTTGELAWLGHVRDFGLSDQGLSIIAYGNWSGLSDVEYSGCLSASLYSVWEPIKPDDDDYGIYSVNSSDQFEMDNNNRLWFNPQKGATIPADNYAAFGFHIPYRYTFDQFTKITALKFDYKMLTASQDSGSNYLKADCRGANWTNTGLWTFEGATLYWSLTGNGSTQSGSQTITSGLSSSYDGIVFRMLAPANSITCNEEATDEYLRITGLRVIGGAYTTSSAVYATAIVKELLDYYVQEFDWHLVSGAKMAIQDTSFDIKHAVYQDKLPSEIMEELAEKENYDVAVWGQRLYFAPEGENSLEWAGVADTVSFETSLDDTRTEIVGVFTTPNGHVLRTSRKEHPLAAYAYGHSSLDAISVPTTVLATADAWAENLRDEFGRVFIRADISDVRVSNHNYGFANPFSVRANDYITLSSSFASQMAELENRFKVGRTTLDLVNGSLKVEPIIPKPSLANPPGETL